MNATSLPVLRATPMMRDFWSGLTRANTVVSGMAAARPLSSILARSVPFMTPATSIPISRHTLAATTPLSPVMIFTSTPSRDNWATAAPASGLGRSAKVRKPASVSWRSSCVVMAEVPAGRSRVATAMTRSPSAKSLSRVV